MPSKNGPWDREHWGESIFQENPEIELTLMYVCKVNEHKLNQTHTALSDSVLSQ